MQMRKLFQHLRNHDLPDLTGHLGPDLGGPSSRIDLPDLTKQVKEFMDQRTNQDDHLSELLDALVNSDGKSTPQPDRTRQNFYQRIQKDHSGGGTGGDTDINIHLCYICDSRCQSDIRHAWSSTQAYFDALSADLQEEFNSMTGYNFEMSTQFLYNVNNRLYGQWYLNDDDVDGSSGDSDVTMLSTVNHHFWEQQDLWGYLLQYLNCDVGIWTVSASDNLWDDYVETVDGVANMFQICGSESYLTVKLDVNINRMSSMVGHELGHCIGMYHDGLLVEAFTMYAAFFHSPGQEELGALYDDLVAQCQDGNPNCPVGGPHSCIMNNVINTQSVYSNCSRAYFNMFFGLARVLPQSYEDSCLPAEDLLLNV